MKKRNSNFKRRAPKQVTEKKFTLDIKDPIRLNKYIAYSGVCSRRKADELIKAGKIKVNGKVVNEPGVKVMPDDKVVFEGKTLQIQEELIYILMNKPKNTISTLSDEKGRRTVIDLVSGSVDQRVYPVGRLDRDTTGLLLITNDGDLAKKISHPSHKVSKIYQVTLDKPIEEDQINQLRKGLIKLEEGPILVDDISILPNTDNLQVGIEIHIGWNRVVRRTFEALGYTVTKLDRVYYAGLTKKDIPRGKWRRLTEREVIMLKHFT